MGGCRRQGEGRIEMLDGDAPNSQQSFSWCFCPSFRSWLLPKPSAQRMSVLVRVAGCTMASDASRIAATVSIEQPGRCWCAMCSMAAIVVMAAVLARSNAKALGRARRLVLGSTGMNSTPSGLCTCGYLLANMHLHHIPMHAPDVHPQDASFHATRMVHCTLISRALPPTCCITAF